MKRILHLIVALSLAFALTSCTENERARAYGGTQTIELPAGRKLINMTWKETDLWLQTRPMREGEHPETSTFEEKSRFGIFEGTIIVKESK